MRTAILFLSLLCLGAGGIDLSTKQVASEILETRSQVYDYAAALMKYDASKKSEYILAEARFRESQKIKNLSAENAALLDKIREAVLRELRKTREYLEAGGAMDEAQLGIEETLASYRQYERALINNGSMVVVQSTPIKRGKK